MNILDNLNEEQLEAVTTTEGYVRVIAGAGTGKTKALTHRFAYLVNDLGISTSNILCVTFTNKAANEMRRRIKSMIGDNNTGFVCTFHGFCAQLLREDIHVLNYPQKFAVLDEEDTETILKNVYEKWDIPSRRCTFADARKYITFQKDTTSSHIPYLMDLNNERLLKDCENEQNIKQKIYLGYLYEQKKSYGLDYDDLITLGVYILENYEEKRKKWQERMMYVMVDEFQDVSGLNYKLADILSGYHKNLFIVGDPDQTIYTWRGAKVEFILNFDKHYPDTKTIILNKNYRSTPEILNVSNSLIKKNSKRLDKDLIAMRESSTMAAYYHAKTVADEATFIANEIKDLIQNGHKYSEIAILYRAHFVTRSFETTFINEEIPYVLYNGVEFYRRKEIKDVLSYLRMILYADDLAFQRVINVPGRNFGKKRFAFITEYALTNNCSMYEALKQNLEEDLIRKTNASEFVRVIEKFKGLCNEMTVSDIFTEVLNESGYEAMLRQAGEQDRLDNLSELKQSIFEFEATSGEDTTLEEYLQNIALFTNSDRSEAKESVKMMTIHTAKGLEFPYVFVCDLNEGIFPSAHVDTIDKLEEERRMAYVAYTRAERLLVLTDAEGVNFDGSYRYPSRFIFNVDKNCLEYKVELEEALVDKAEMFICNDEAKYHPETTTFQVGNRVKHKVFGEGIINDINQGLSAYVIKFDKFDTERNISFIAPLQKA